MNETPAPSRRGLLWHGAALLVLYVAAFLVRSDVAEHRVSAGHGDVSAYYHVAKNLYAGRGFVQDFIADFLQDPQGPPTPSNMWWLPLPSIIAWAGMELAGDDSYAAAQRAMIAVASLVPLVVYFAALLLLRTRAAALAAGALAVGFHLYLDQPLATLSHGPYSVFAGGAVVSLLALARHPRALPLFGLMLGLTYLCRGDSQVLLAEFALVLLCLRFLRKEPWPIPWKGLLLAAAAFLAVVGPWWVRNYRVIGEIMPSGVKKVAWAREYEDWFSDPDRLTPKRLVAGGWEHVLEMRRRELTDAVRYTPEVMWASVVRDVDLVRADPDHSQRPLLNLALYVLTPLLWLGALILLVLRPWSTLLVLLHLVLLAIVYAVVFPAVGRESYRSSMFSVFPVLLTMILAPLWLALRPLERRSPRVAGAILVTCGVALAWANVDVVRPHLEKKAGSVEELLARYRHFGQWWEKNSGPDAVFFVRNPWEFTVETGLRSVMLPNMPAERTLEFARRYGVQFFLDEDTKDLPLDVIRPGAAALIARGDAVEAPNPSAFRLYRIIPSALKDPSAADPPR